MRFLKRGDFVKFGYRHSETSVEIRAVFEAAEHEVGNNDQNDEWKVGSDKDPDLIPVVRGVFDLFFNVRLLPEHHIHLFLHLASLLKGCQGFFGKIRKGQLPAFFCSFDQQLVPVLCAFPKHLFHFYERLRAVM